MRVLQASGPEARRAGTPPIVCAECWWRRACRWFLAGCACVPRLETGTQRTARCPHACSSCSPGQSGRTRLPLSARENGLLLWSDIALISLDESCTASPLGETLCISFGTILSEAYPQGASHVSLNERVCPSSAQLLGRCCLLGVFRWSRCRLCGKRSRSWKPTGWPASAILVGFGAMYWSCA